MPVSHPSQRTDRPHAQPAGTRRLRAQLVRRIFLPHNFIARMFVDKRQSCLKCSFREMLVRSATRSYVGRTGGRLSLLDGLFYSSYFRSTISVAH